MLRFDRDITARRVDGNPQAEVGRGEQSSQFIAERAGRLRSARSRLVGGRFGGDKQRVDLGLAPLRIAARAFDSGQIDALLQKAERDERVERQLLRWVEREPRRPRIVRQHRFDFELDFAEISLPFAQQRFARDGRGNLDQQAHVVTGVNSKPLGQPLVDRRLVAGEVRRFDVDELPQPFVAAEDLHAPSAA